MQDFYNMKVWEKVHSIVPEIYAVTKLFPKDEIYGLTSTLRRSAAAVPINIGEGCAEEHRENYLIFFTLEWIPQAKSNTCSS